MLQTGHRKSAQLYVTDALAARPAQRPGRGACWPGARGHVHGTGECTRERDPVSTLFVDLRVRTAQRQEVLMSTHELAQLNIGIIKGPMDSPVMADFAANLERINTVAEAAPGFVWRLQTGRGRCDWYPSVREREHARQHVGVEGSRLTPQVRLSLRARRCDASPSGVVRGDGRGIPRAVVGTAGAPAEHRRSDRPARSACEPRDRVPRRSHSAVHFRRRARHRTNLRSSWVIAALPRDTMLDVDHLCLQSIGVTRSRFDQPRCRAAPGRRGCS